ncbi:MAG: hypothetical protein QM788_05175 [Roseateles sp.]|uniref:hypothetical protein n=1 Tax=Roseateles sp. TaxID=1971397 RepID=UPI0039EB95B0
MEEHQRLLKWQLRLTVLVDEVRDSDDYCTWYAIAQASLEQLDNDIDRLFQWLLDTERAVQVSSRE